MLEGNFFYVTSTQSGNGKVSAVLEIDPTHAIFEGHFPGQPVVPGVCMMQIIKEVLEKETGRPTNMYAAENLKFLSVINPAENNVIQLELTYSVAADIQVNATLFNGSLVYFKMKGMYVFN